MLQRFVHDPRELSRVDHGEISVDDVDRPVDVTASIRDLHDFDPRHADPAKGIGHLLCTRFVRSHAMANKHEIFVRDDHIGALEEPVAVNGLDDRHAHSRERGCRVALFPRAAVGRHARDHRSG